MVPLSPSLSRHRPTGSKFSSANPTGSIVRWQLAHTGSLRWAASLSRIGRLPGTFPSSAGTFGSGGGGGAPKILLNTHTPRITGEVRVAKDVTDRTLPRSEERRVGKEGRSRGLEEA